MIECRASRAFIARFYIGRQVLAIDDFCQNAGAGGFAHAARATKQKRLRQFIAFEGVFERGGDGGLPDNVFETNGAVFAGRNDKRHIGKGRCLGIK